MTEFGLLKARGIIGFSDVNKTIQNSELMSRIMNYASDIDVLIMQHAEDYELAKNSCINQGEVATRLGLQGVSDIAEKIIIERDLSLLSVFPCRYHINQISSKNSLNVIKKNKSNGIKFSTGVSINNLSLNQNDIGEFRTFLKLSPPLRSEEDRISLIEGIKNDLIDVIVSDHIPEDEESKRLPFAQAATGSIGIETLLSLALELYHNDSLPLEKIIKCLTIWFVVSYGFSIIFVEYLNNIRIGGYKLGFWFAQQGSIYSFVLLIFYYVYEIGRIDKRYGVYNQ